MLRFAALFITVLIVAGMSSTPAQAQYPCSGPGPGEIVVGQTPGNPSQPPMQLCQYVGVDEGPGDAPSRGPAGPQYVESSMATATHIDTSAVWGTAGHRSPEAARRRVMDACAAVMGEGCVYAEAWTGDVRIAVALDGSGAPWIKGADHADAEREALARCEENGGVYGCRSAFSFPNILIPATADRDADYSRVHFPDAPVRRHNWVLHAWPETPPASWRRSRSWLAAGRTNFSTARLELLERCRTESGSSCVLGMAVSNGGLAHYVNRRGQSHWISVAGPTSAAARVEEACGAGEGPCRLVTLYDAAAARTLVVENPELTRGYVSLAWPSSGGWGRMAIVTGRPTIAAANADALALCQSRSGVRCELYMDDPDAKTSSFLGLYAMPGGQTLLSFGHSLDHLNERAAQTCARRNVTCTNRAVVDLHETGESTPALND